MLFAADRIIDEINGVFAVSFSFTFRNGVLWWFLNKRSMIIGLSRTTLYIRDSSEVLQGAPRLVSLR